MANEVVKYNNDMNTVSFRKFNTRELDIFFAICSKLKEKDIEKISFQFSELRTLSNITVSTIDEFITILDDVYSKMLQLNIRIGNSIDFIRFNIFSNYEVRGSEQEVIIKTNPDFKWVLNELTSNFTRFELSEFVNISSSYTKECYRRLKQFKSTGKWKIPIDEFRRLLDIPDTYRMCDIDKWVLKPIEKELTPLFKNFKMQKIKTKGRGRGGVVSFIEFSFAVDKINQYTTTSNKKQTKTSVRNIKSYSNTPSLTDFELEKLILSKNDLDKF